MWVYVDEKSQTFLLLYVHVNSKPLCGSMCMSMPNLYVGLCACQCQTSMWVYVMSLPNLYVGLCGREIPNLFVAVCACQCQTSMWVYVHVNAEPLCGSMCMSMPNLYVD